ILDSNFNLIKEWRHSIVQASAIQDELNPLLSPEDQQAPIEDEENFLPLDNIFFLGFIAVTILAIAGIGFMKLYQRLREPPKTS
ncbi:MAG: hypothetical protein ACFFB3_03410, partial [Candidatus Hodarchaeota archaeon]